MLKSTVTWRFGVEDLSVLDNQKLADVLYGAGRHDAVTRFLTRLAIDYRRGNIGGEKIRPLVDRMLGVISGMHYEYPNERLNQQMKTVVHCAAEVFNLKGHRRNYRAIHDDGICSCSQCNTLRKISSVLKEGSCLGWNWHYLTTSFEGWPYFAFNEEGLDLMSTVVRHGTADQMDQMIGEYERHFGAVAYPLLLLAEGSKWRKEMADVDLDQRREEILANSCVRFGIPLDALRATVQLEQR